MLSYDEIAAMSTEEFVKHWESGEIQKSSLELLGYRYATLEEKDPPESEEK